MSENLTIVEETLPVEKPEPVKPPTPAEQLKLVNDAIAAVLAGGQSYRLGDRSLTRANLAELRALRDQLETAQTEDDGLWPRTYVARFDGR